MVAKKKNVKAKKKTPSKARPAKFVLRLHPDLHASIKDRAARTGISMNELISVILKDYEKRAVMLEP